MILYSHLWDLLLKLLLVVVLLVVLVGVIHLDQSIGVWPMIAVLVLLFILIYRQLLSTVAAWLYARFSLGAGLSLAEARRLARLVQLDMSFKWIPLKDVKKLPTAQRHDAVMAAVERIEPRRRAMFL